VSAGMERRQFLNSQCREWRLADRILSSRCERLGSAQQSAHFYAQRVCADRNDERVTVIVNHSEMGQGSTLPAHAACRGT